VAASENPDPPCDGLVFIETEPFSEMADSLLGDEGRQILQNRLLINSVEGDVIQGTGGARKIRVPLQGRGKTRKKTFRPVTRSSLKSA
jgi:hypothetical protein